MPENKPSLDEWRALYEAAIRFKELAPWQWMEELDIFGILNPESGEIGFASIMGMAMVAPSGRTAGSWSRRPSP